MSDEKLLIGPRIRRLRQALGLTQMAMAQDLSISTSYLNLIERNQRPLSAKVLLRLADTYDIDLAELSPGQDIQTTQALREIVKTAAFQGTSISRDEIEDCVNASPALMQAVVEMHNKLQDYTVRLSMREDPAGDRDQAGLIETANSPVESVRKFIQDNGNYFDDLDKAAEQLAAKLGVGSNKPQTALSQHLETAHGIRTRIVPADILPGKLSLFDPHERRLNLSEQLPQSGRRLRIAYQLGMLAHNDMIEAAIADADLPSKDAKILCRVNLANYFAAALLMPYGRFYDQAEAARYDIELLSRRFGTSYEQTAHRLTTLQRKGAAGVPFFFVRVDMAGNVSKRFSGGRFHFSRYGGACPLWNIHHCFQTPGESLPQAIEMPDGTRYFSIARAVLRPGAKYGQRAQMVAIGLGCEMAHVGRLVYADDFQQARPTPIGINCYFCERPNCTSRAHPPLNSALHFDERARGLSIFKFEKN